MTSVSLTCVQCNAPFPAYRLTQRYCTAKCRNAAYAARHPTVPGSGMAPNLDTGKVGTIGELLVTVDLFKRGYEVFRAVSQSASCDLLALRDGQVIRIEVRTAMTRSDGTVKLSRYAHDNGRQDIFAGVSATGEVYYRRAIDSDTGTCWVDVAL